MRSGPEDSGKRRAFYPLTPVSLNYPQQAFDAALFPVEENAAIAQLRQFCAQGADRYELRRDFPAVEGTSRLSASLATGGLSPRQCLHRLLAEQPQALDGGPGSVWLNELIWREFYRHLMTWYPALCQHQPFIRWTKRVTWQENSHYFQAWQKGETGYPIVDAAMRQLNATGWMHNRLRMITASFLVKDLLIDWRLGERYFMSQLIDGDLAANNGGWQWAASTGTDAAPYFRIFNPTTQGRGSIATANLSASGYRHYAISLEKRFTSRGGGRKKRESCLIILGPLWITNRRESRRFPPMRRREKGVIQAR